MQSSALMTLLCNAGLPASGYDFELHSLNEREALLERLCAAPGVVVTNHAAVTLIEDKAAHAIYIVTRPGHFAHPSMIQRAILRHDGARTVQVRGFTAADPAIMSAWLGQFRAEDELIRQSYAG